ncbi:hypothetical protein ACGFS9_14945 [Streptomyces sp. NPDC048566]|uniref:hypothetical protein n=1 Tax=Streptomyces sp. NPDC048566 TaxID=3365569 RepID=UPI0037249F46
MSETGGMRLVIGLADMENTIQGTVTTTDRILKLTPPPSFDAEHISLATNDLQAILASLKQNPKAHVDLQNALLNKDLPTALGLTRSLGLTEDDLRAAGGGLWGVVVVVAVLCAVMLASDSGTSGGEAPPSDGGADAGTG